MAGKALSMVLVIRDFVFVVFETIAESGSGG